MIQYLQRNEVNVAKYDTCVSQAFNSRIYAYSWYLDCVCDDWDVLIKNDYEAVMPLPKRKKYGIHYIYLPPWTQQLGIFYKDKFDKVLIDDFINSIPKRFSFINTYLNSSNVFQSNYSIERSNYELSLAKQYTNIINEYSKGRKSSISKAKKYKLQVIEDYNYKEGVNFFTDNIWHELAINTSDSDKLYRLLEKADKLDNLFSLAVLSHGKLVGVSIFLIDNQRITYLLSAVNKQGREMQAMSLLLDEIIKKYANKKYILDFEGSEIDELAFFFKSFGAINIPYKEIKIYRNSLVKLIRDLIKSIKK